MNWLFEAGEWLAQNAGELGPWGAFLISLSDSAFIPMPQGVDALLIAEGVAHPESAYPAAAMAILGSLLGSLVLYQVARKGGRGLLERKVSAERAEKLRRQIDEYGPLALLPAVMIPLPLPMKPLVIAAGVFQMDRKEFVAAIVFARAVRYFGEAWVARAYGEETMSFLAEHAVIGIAGGIALVLVFFLVHHYASKQMKGAG